MFMEARMHRRTLFLATVLAAGCVTSSCRETTPVSPTPPLSVTCDASAAKWAIGEPASDDLLERARVAAGARLARFLRPNQPITLEYLGWRLNLGLDTEDIVKGVVCG
jgi:hypothetical protein